MRVAKVIVIQITGRKNKLYELGETVNENQFVLGRFDELLKGGYIELIEETPEPVTSEVAEEVEVIAKPVDDKPEGVKQAEEREANEEKLEGDASEEDAPEPENLDDTTRKQIMKELDEAGVKYNKNMSKAELYELWREKNK